MAEQEKPIPYAVQLETSNRLFDEQSPAELTISQQKSYRIDIIKATRLIVKNINTSTGKVWARIESSQPYTVRINGIPIPVETIVESNNTRYRIGDANHWKTELISTQASPKNVEIIPQNNDLETPIVYRLSTEGNTTYSIELTSISSSPQMQTASVLGAQTTTATNNQLPATGDTLQISPMIILVIICVIIGMRLRNLGTILLKQNF
jgi:hypothetical protein